MLSLGRNLTQNAVLITFAQKIQQIFSCSIQKACVVKPENAILALPAGVPGKPFRTGTGARSLEQQRYSLLLASDHCSLGLSPASHTVQFLVQPPVSHQGPFQLETSAVCHQIFIVQIVFQGSIPGTVEVMWPLPPTPILPRAYLFEKPVKDKHT